MKKNRITLLLAGCCAIVATHNAYALTETMSASVTFIAPLAISSVTSPSFGKLSADVDSTVYTLGTDGSVRVASGPGSALGGSPAAGSMTISGSSTQTIDISSGNLMSDGGIEPSAVMCKYGSGSEVSCNDTSLNTASAPGGGTVLKVGLTVTTTGAEADGDTAEPGFDITVVYN